MAFSLYQRWRETADRRAEERAVCENGVWLDFRELERRLEKRPAARETVIARTGGADFFVEVLRAWRDGRAVVPVEAGAAAPMLSAPVPEGMALVKYTPGAAGVPRGIRFTPEAVAADGDRIVREMGLCSEFPNLGVVSLAHSYGFSNVVLPLLLHGVPVVLAAAPFPALVEAAFAHAGGPMVVPAVPPMWRAWLRAGRLGNWPVKRAVSAGSPLSLALERAVYEEAGIKIHNFYGASECGGIAWDASETPRETEGLVGKPMAGVMVRISSDGRIVVESDATGAGYDETREGDALGNGIYLTRDMGRFARNGLVLSGKLAGAINVAGRKVSPAKVERAIRETEKVSRVRVIGFPSHDPERFEEIAALVELREGVSLAELKSDVADRLPLWEVPRKWLEEAALWREDDGALARRAAGRAAGRG